MTKERMAELEERTKRLETWIHSMHEILHAHSRYIMEQVDDETSTHPYLAIMDEAHEFMKNQMNKYLGNDEETEE